jgi:hypothetical protein
MVKVRTAKLSNLCHIEAETVFGQVFDTTVALKFVWKEGITLKGMVTRHLIPRLHLSAEDEDGMVELVYSEFHG